MVNGYRIKEVIFPAQTVNGSTLSAVYTPFDVNGDVVRVIVRGVQSPGSVWLAESGTNIEFWRKNDFASGTTNVEAYPFVYPVNSTNVTGSPQAFVLRSTNTKLYIAASGLTSGTGTTFGPIEVYYR